MQHQGHQQLLPCLMLVISLGQLVKQQPFMHGMLVDHQQVILILNKDKRIEHHAKQLHRLRRIRQKAFYLLPFQWCLCNRFRHRGKGRRQGFLLQIPLHSGCRTPHNRNRRNRSPLLDRYCRRRGVRLHSRHGRHSLALHHQRLGLRRIRRHCFRYLHRQLGTFFLRQQHGGGAFQSIPIRNAVPNNILHGLCHGSLVLKAHLQLVGMHVYIHLLIGHGQVNHTGGILADHDPFPHAALHGRGKETAPHVSPVNEEGFVAAVAPGAFPNAYIAVNHHTALTTVHAAHGTLHFRAVNAEHSGFQLSIPSRMVQGLSLADVAERHVRS